MMEDIDKKVDADQQAGLDAELTKLGYTKGECPESLGEQKGFDVSTMVNKRFKTKFTNKEFLEQNMYCQEHEFSRFKGRPGNSSLWTFNNGFLFDLGGISDKRKG
jgi:hypothetical protein